MLNLNYLSRDCQQAGPLPNNPGTKMNYIVSIVLWCQGHLYVVYLDIGLFPKQSVHIVSYMYIFIVDLYSSTLRYTVNSQVVTMDR